MADNVELNAGTGGVTAATDEVDFGAGAVHVQMVKLVSGADGATDRIAGDATNGLDVDVTRVIPGTSATHLGKAEDAAHASGDTGVMALTVRANTAAATSGADGDYQPLITDTNGRLHVLDANSAAALTAAQAIQTAVEGTLTVGSHAVTNAGTFAVQVSSALPAGNNNIGDVDVASLPSLPAGSNAIGTVTAVGAAAEDAAASGNPVLVGGRYDSTPRTLETGDAGAIALNASGQVLVEIAAGAGSGGTAAADDADFTATSTSGTPVMGVYESSPTSVTDGDMGIVGITQTRALKVAIASGGVAGIAEDSAHAGGEEGVLVLGVRRDTPASGAGTDGDHATINLSSAGRVWASATIDAALPAGTNNIGDVDILSIAAGNNNIGDVDIASIAAGDNNIGNVDIVTMPNVTLAAGTNTNEVVGDAAHDAPIAGNPIRIAGRALTSDYTAVAAGDVADLITTLLGKLVVMPYANPNNTWSYAAPAGGLVSTTAVTIKTAAGAGIRNYITHIDVVNSHQTTSTELVINDGAGGTVLWRGWLQAAGGGYSINFDPPLRGTANTLLEIDEITATGTAGVLFNCTGFTAAE